MTTSGNWFAFYRSYANCAALGHGTEWDIVGSWVAILAKARWEPTIYKGEQILRGQFGFTYRDLQKEWRMSPNKLKRSFDHFIGHGMIDIRRTSKCSILTVKNYDIYQPASVIESVTLSGQRYRSGNGSDNASDNALYKNKKVKKDLARTRTTFTKPTVRQVAAYCKERGNAVSPSQFIDHYEANGWRVGKVSMKNWKAAVRKWERNGFDASKNGKHAPAADYPDAKPRRRL